MEEHLQVQHFRLISRARGKVNLRLGGGGGRENTRDRRTGGLINDSICALDPK